ncbi:MAG: hypothetical protein IKT46_02490 [Clostridia bacterium]|nr:hypothetical protein [Clostridia bacterium]
MRITLNKDKNIGKVLYIVEGSKTEKFLLWKIFANIFDYQVEAITRSHPYQIFNRKDNPYSKVFVINAAESNIKNIEKDDEFLNNLFIELIENYDFDIDNAAIYYLFDRDAESNTDPIFIKNLLNTLTNSRENEENYRQGILLLSYPSIESFTLSCFKKDCFSLKVNLGSELKRYLNINNFNQSNINESQLQVAVDNLVDSLMLINNGNFDIDNFKELNVKIFDLEESTYSQESMFNCLSLLAFSLIDLGLVEIES